MDSQISVVSSQLKLTSQVPNGCSPGASKARLVLVDDNDVFIDFFTDLAAEIGLEVASFNSAQQAVAAFESGCAARVDLVVTDYRMPEMTGVEVAKALRETGYTQTIVLMSSDSLASIRAAHPDVGQYVSGYFSKEESLTDTIHMIASILAHIDLANDTK